MRLIDADTLQFVPKGTKHVVGVKSFLNLMAAVQEAVDKTPTIDAVPVVRCKECRFRGNPMNCPMCHEEDYYNEDDGFDYIVRDEAVDEGYCQKGEREDDNE